MVHASNLLTIPLILILGGAGALEEDFAQENAFQIDERAGGGGAVENAVVECEPHFQPAGVIEHPIVNLRRQERHQVQDADALSAEGA
jgi:hypothetical protein